MASLTITVPDIVVPRIRMAFGHSEPINPQNPAGAQQWVPATVEELQVAIKMFVRSRVIEYEVTQDAIASRTTKSGEDWNA